jgi:hypothetical protein
LQVEFNRFARWSMRTALWEGSSRRRRPMKSDPCGRESRGPHRLGAPDLDAQRAPAQCPAGQALVDNLFRGKRRPLAFAPTPTGVLKRRAFVAAFHATCRATQPIARGVGTPPDYERSERNRHPVQASRTDHPPPTNLALELRERWWWRLVIHGASVPLFA